MKEYTPCSRRQVQGGGSSPKAHELDPDNTGHRGARQIAKIQVAQWDATQLKEARKHVPQVLNNAEDPGPQVE